MTAKIIDGKAFATKLREGIAREVTRLKAEHNVIPGLAVVLVGNDPASDVYVTAKHKATVAAGMNSFEYRLDEKCNQEQLIALIDELNKRADVHGILVQMPLPKGLDAAKVIEAIRPEKDVDGFHKENVGMLSTQTGKPLIPCTPLGASLMLKDHLGNLEGLDAVVIGRSNIVGKPMVQLLLSEGCTVTVCHSKTKNIPEICRRADILVAAVGIPHFVKSDWVKPGATVIDVGINRIEHEGKRKLVGDVDTKAAQDVAGAITPVPGGVGPMTIACLLANTLTATTRSLNKADPNWLAIIQNH